MQSQDVATLELSSAAAKRAEGTYLNIGSGNMKLPGFINIDMEPGADIHLDVTTGLPFEDHSVDGIFNEHFIEHISQAEGIKFFRECRRVLKPGGRIRVATPDLDFIVNRYLKEDWRGESEMIRLGWGWVDNPCEQINLSMRSWGHQWLYNSTELNRVAITAGLLPMGRFPRGVSDDPAFHGLEYRPGSRLVCEFVSRAPVAETAKPLISIILAVSETASFEKTFSSALNQSYPFTEIIVADSSADNHIQQITAAHLEREMPVKYYRHEGPGGWRESYAAALNRSNGRYITALRDGHTLVETALAQMVGCLNVYPQATLVATTLSPVASKTLADPVMHSYRCLSIDDGIIDGANLIQSMLADSVNLLHNLSGVMFRHRDLIHAGEDPFAYAGRTALTNAEATLWVKLLGMGELVYLSTPLCSYDALNAEQVSTEVNTQPQTWEQLRFDAARMGSFEQGRAISGEIGAEDN